MQKKHLFIPLIALTLIIFPLLIALPALAVTTSPTPVPVPSPTTPDDSTVTENIKKRLQESLDNQEVNTSSLELSKAKAYIGIVKDVIKDTLIVEDKDGKKDIKLIEDTDILRTPGNTVIKPENIRIEDYIIAIGYPDEDGTLKGRRLIVSINPIKAPEKTTGLGTITKISKTTLTLTIDNKDQVVSTTTKTIYKSSVGTIESTDLSVGDTVIYTALSDDQDNLTATVIMRTGTAAIDE